MNDKIKHLESRMKDKIENDCDALYVRMMKVNENCENRIKTAEIFTKDKYMESASQIKLVD